MARIIGDYTGTTFDDLTVLPDWYETEPFTQEDVDISTELAGVRLRIPFITAAMRSVTGEELLLAAGKLGMMGVGPRDMPPGVIHRVKSKEVKKGEIETEYTPTEALETETLGAVLEKAKKTGHSNIPIKTRMSDFLGMFQYAPSRHDKMDPSMLITHVMQRYEKGSGSMHVCTTAMSDDAIKKYLKGNKLRFVPVIDEVGRLDRLVFLQTFEAYKVGAAIDTHPGWEERARSLVEEGADMIFIDTSDAQKPFSYDVVEKFKKMFGDGPPICGGNVVTPRGFDYLAKAGADVIKLGMGPGSICSTNEVLGVGAPPMWSLVEVAKRRDDYKEKGGKYIPIIADGGINGTKAIAVALTHADAIMGGQIFGCFLESESEKLSRNGRTYPRGQMNEADIVLAKIFGEGSKEARGLTGEMKRYVAPHSNSSGVSTYQGVSGLIPYRGRFKPGVEEYMMALRESMYHAGARNLANYRRNAVLVRLSERAKEIGRPHDIEVLG